MLRIGGGIEEFYSYSVKLFAFERMCGTKTTKADDVDYRSRFIESPYIHIAIMQLCDRQ